MDLKKFEEFDGGSTYKPVLKSKEDDYSMAKVQLEKMIENINDILGCLPDGDLPAWVQDKISVSNHSMEAISDWCKTGETNESEKKKNLWDNIRAKKKRGEKAAKPGDEGYPDKKNWDKLTKKKKK